MHDDEARPGEGITVSSDERFVSRHDGITTRHSFSFGDHYDPENVALGPLVAFNKKLFAPGTGYAEHEHRDLDIVTWVLEGTLAHHDSAGRRVTITNGTVQRLTAGTGIRHGEANAGGPGESLRLVQLWFRPGAAEAAVAPSYETWTLEDGDDWLGVTAIAASRTAGRCASLTVPGVTVRVGRLPRGSTARSHGSGERGSQAWQLYVAGGHLDTRELGLLETGDAVRAIGPDRSDLQLRSVDDTVVLTVALDERPTGR